MGVPVEVYPHEQRVALTPQNTALLLKKGFGRVLVEKSAGVHAQFPDEQYRAAGAILVDRTEVYGSSDILLKVRPPILGQEVEHVKEGGTVISFLYPNQSKGIVEALASKKATAFAMEMIPRISRAQVFDALRYVRSCASHVAHIDVVMQFYGQYCWLQGSARGSESFRSLLNWSGHRCRVCIPFVHTRFCNDVLQAKFHHARSLSSERVSQV